MKRSKNEKVMKTIILLSAIIFLFLYSCVQNNFLNLDYQSFDQTPNSGWRKVAQEEGFAEAGKSIDRYIKKHHDLDVSQAVNLSFHSGQMYAFANRYEIALERFKKAKYDQESEKIPEEEKAFLEVWNAYVDATIAFLQRDKMKLLACRKQIANGPSIDGANLNLDVVDSLIKNFDEPYSVAYVAHRGKSIRR